MNLTTIIRDWFARRATKKAERDLVEAERIRSTIVRQMNERKAAHKEWKPLAGLLRQATEKSLRASIGRGA